MARQDVIRALVPRDRIEELVGGIAERLELDPDAIDVDDVRPGVVLLDTDHPRVGEGAAGERPARPDAGEPGAPPN